MSITRSPRNARRDPFVDHEMPPVPVVLLPAHRGACARRSARGGGHALRLVALYVGALHTGLSDGDGKGSPLRPAAGRRGGGGASIWCAPRAALSERRADPGRQHPLPRLSRPVTTTTSGGSTSARFGRAQVLAKVTKALGAEPSRLRPLARDRRRDGLLQPQPAGRRSDRGSHLQRTISPGMLRTLRAKRRASSASRCEPSPPTLSGCHSRTGASTSCWVMPCSITSRTCRARFREFERVLAPGGIALFAGEPSRYGDRLARIPKARRWRGSRPAMASRGARPGGAPRPGRRAG